MVNSNTVNPQKIVPKKSRAAQPAIRPPDYVDKSFFNGPRLTAVAYAFSLPDAFEASLLPTSPLCSHPVTAEIADSQAGSMCHGLSASQPTKDAEKNERQAENHPELPRKRLATRKLVVFDSIDKMQHDAL